MAVDLFVWINSLWNKDRPEGSPPVFVMQRFLVSDRNLAQAARVLQRDVPDAKMMAHTWRGILPEAAAAPRMGYAAPKKGPQAEELTQRMMSVRKIRRDQAEAEQAMIDSMGLLLDLYLEYGVEPPGDLVRGKSSQAKVRKAKKSKAKKKEAPRPATGLLGIVSK